MAYQGFQQQVYPDLAPGVEGAWAGVNPHSSLLAGPGALKAGPNGVAIGRFAWANADGIVGVGGTGRIGFVQRDQISLITIWLGSSNYTIPAGYEVTLFTVADVWARFAAGAVPGQKVFANFSDGTAFAGTAGAPSGATATTFSIAPGTIAVTGGIANGVLTITAVGTGPVYPGTTIAATGIPTGEQIDEQVFPLTGTEAIGGIGRYLLTVDNGTYIAPGTAITGTYGLLTAGGTITGGFSPGDPLTGTGVTAGTTIWANAQNGSGLTGAGAAGTYVVSPTQTAATGTLTASTNQETAWYVESFAAAGELAMISTRT